VPPPLIAVRLAMCPMLSCSNIRPTALNKIVLILFDVLVGVEEIMLHVVSISGNLFIPATMVLYQDLQTPNSPNPFASPPLNLPPRLGAPTLAIATVDKRTYSPTDVLQDDQNAWVAQELLGHLPFPVS
jgi:hypothetical protein